MKPRLTLVTHVDWGHIRQRPHQLADALGALYQVSVVSPVSRKRTDVVENPAPEVTLARVWRVPGSYRSAPVARANAVLAGLQCAPAIRRANVVIVTSPELWPWIAGALGGRTLVYDCMDDALAFDQHPMVRALKARWEQQLLQRSDAIVCSSDELAARAASRGAPPGRTTVIPNGWDDAAFPIAVSRALPHGGPLELVYFGTLAPWLDAAALRAVAAAMPDVTLRLIGPGDGGELRDVKGIRIEPPIEHARLAHATASAHALMLPFRVDELTRAVDPVKLYEYIALGKPIVASHWPALDRFAGFVTFYRDAAHLVDLLRTRSLAAPPPAQTRAAFLAPQSWQARAAAMHDAIVRATR